MVSQNVPQVEPEAKQSSCLKYFGGCSGLGLIGVIALVLFYIVLVGLGKYLIVSDPLKPASTLVVLSGDSGGRMVETASLYNKQFAEVVILTETGSPSDNGEIETPSTQAKRLDALHEGIPEESILITPSQSTSTQDEAKAVLSLMQAKNMTSCIVVTDSFHSRRTRAIFTDYFRGSGITVMVHPVSNDGYHASTWFLSLQGWKTTVSEYIKYIGFLTIYR